VHVAERVAAAANHDAGVHHQRLRLVGPVVGGQSQQRASVDGEFVVDHDRVGGVQLRHTDRQSEPGPSFEECLSPRNLHQHVGAGLRACLLHVVRSTFLPS